MNCDEFELVGLDDSDAAALAHANSCARCAALLDRWQAARAELRALGEETRHAQTPARVEMRLLQEVRAARRPRWAWHFLPAAAWGVAAIALIAVLIGWSRWHSARAPEVVKQNPAPSVSAPQTPAEKSAPTIAANANPPRRDVQQVKRSGSAANRNVSARGGEAEPFSLLPGISPQDAEQTDMVRVRMRRGALGALGLPVNEERASDWIQVDMLVGYDGQPRAVRLDRTATQGATEW